jgi:hypothetical protein
MLQQQLKAVADLFDCELAPECQVSEAVKSEQGRRNKWTPVQRKTQERSRSGGLDRPCTELKPTEDSEDLAPANIVRDFFFAIPDWVIKSNIPRANGSVDAKIVVELKTPQRLGRNLKPGSNEEQEQVHLEEYEPVWETLRNAAQVGQDRVGKMFPVLRQAFTQVAAHVTPYAVVTDGIDFLFLKCGRKASQSGQLDERLNQDNTLQIEYYVARYCDEGETSPSFAQCLVYMMHHSMNEPHIHKWPQDRLKILMSQKRPKGREGNEDQDHRCDAESTSTCAAPECAQCHTRLLCLADHL